MKKSTVYTTPKKHSIWEELLQAGRTDFFWGQEEDSLELRNRVTHLTQRYQKSHFHLEALRKWLEKENPAKILTEKQKQHLDSLKETKSLFEPLFVITGQQPSLLTGPMLCIYKGLTAITLAEKWQRILQRPVIPLFWLAGDDTDLEECGVVEWLDHQKEFASRLEVEYPWEKIPMSLRSLEKGWEKLQSQKQGEWNKDVIDLIQNTITPHDTIVSSAQKILQRVLGPLGLLFVDGFSETFRKLAQPTIKRVVQESFDLKTYIQKSTKKWSQQGHVPPVELTKRTIHAFALEKINSHPSQHHLVVRRRLHTVEEAKEFLDTGSITHDVLSRPLLIEGVFPALGHVLGPNELGYFLQLEETFQKWFGHRPLLSPRMSATWMSRQQFMSMQEEGVDKEKIPFIVPSEFRRQFVEQRWAQTLEQQSWKGNISSNLQGILDFLRTAGKLPSSPKYTPLFTTFKERLGKQGDWLESKLKKMTLKKYATEYQSHKSTLHWLAQGHGQDRHLNWLSIVNSVGENKALRLLQTLKPLEKQHQLLVWEE